MLKKILKGMLLVSSASMATIATISCSNKEQKNIIKVKLSNNLKENQIPVFEDKINTLIRKKGGDFVIKLTVEGDNDSYERNVSDLLSGKQDLVFTSSGKILSKKEELKRGNISLGIQTLTKMFKGTNDNTEKYIHGLESDPLRIIAKKEQKLFDRIPRDKWNDKEKGNSYSDSEYIYKDFYTDKLTEFYRGIIFIIANDEDTENIIKAWESKDLEKFLSYGYVHSLDKESGSKYILPQALLKKHFGNKFVSFLDLIDKEKSPFKGDKKPIKNNKVNLKDKKIFFDAEGLYSWTKFKDIVNDPFSISTERPGQKFTFLTVTDVLPYNIGLYNSKISKENIKIFSESLNDLAKNKEDLWGPAAGFHGYKFIEDEDKIFEIIENTLG
ncbi:High affinity transport system protein p37 [Mycoplasmopsis canis PG 14]|uniref:High affinity transport system protein p37 n=1 Tax=Mycoplasmopsis canis TaxID=29555 RepID=A0A449AQF8_9BACT|nr:DNA repair protein HhH-GPD [Mycoplasmopsis canis]AMD81320.1 DNA repair protein [Mycoplasmopsis canis PG 14]EIE40537.1 High affinity transport system protein p37 [Mycoplasmopsis canis PG 14]VEU68707.1 High affinity transport system protein p37 precursor [Mycoplasmopsis canis]